METGKNVSISFSSKFLLLILAAIIEGLDLLPLPFFDQILEIPLEIFYLLFFKMVTKTSFFSCIILFLIERIPLISDILPTWLLYLLYKLYFL